MSQQVDYAQDLKRPQVKEALYRKALAEIVKRYPRFTRQRQRREARRIAKIWYATTVKQLQGKTAVPASAWQRFKLEWMPVWFVNHWPAKFRLVPKEENSNSMPSGGFQGRDSRIRNGKAADH